MPAIPNSLQNSDGRNTRVRIPQDCNLSLIWLCLLRNFSSQVKNISTPNESHNMRCHASRNWCFPENC